MLQTPVFVTAFYCNFSRCQTMSVAYRCPVVRLYSLDNSTTTNNTTDICTKTAFEITKTKTDTKKIVTDITKNATNITKNCYSN